MEWRAGGLLCELLGLDGGDGKGWLGRTFTTGATGSNVLGLACGREAVLGRKIRARRVSLRTRGERALEPARDADGDGHGESDSVGDLGLLEACRLAGVEELQVLTTMGHSSLSKAASIVGLGRRSVKDVGLEAEPWRFDMQRLEGMLAREGTASIVVVSCGEVNTGRYATSGLEEMRRLRGVCDRFGAWLHVDGGPSPRYWLYLGAEVWLTLNTAFGLFARALPPGDEFAVLREACEGIELANSITGDAHKCLNVVSQFFPLDICPYPSTCPNLAPNPTHFPLPSQNANSQHPTNTPF